MADFDKKLASELEHDETFQGIMAQLKEAANSEVTIRVADPCTKPGCNCKHIRMVKVPNYDLKLKIAQWLAERGVGRPNSADNDADGERITFIREVRK